jgi:hypothetical protein
MNHTYHLCKSGRQQPGSREECPNCTPAVKKINAVIVKQAQQIAELKAALNSSTDLLNLAQHQVPNQADAMLLKSKVDSNLALLAKPVTEKAEAS